MWYHNDVRDISLIKNLLKLLNMFGYQPQKLIQRVRLPSLSHTPTLESLIRLLYHVKYAYISTLKVSLKNEVALTYLYTQQPENLSNMRLQTHFNKNNHMITLWSECVNVPSPISFIL
jgi:hypothetical protein